MAEDPPALVVRVLHAAEFLSEDALDAIVPSHDFVDESVIGTEEIEDAPVLLDHVIEEHVGFLHQPLR